MHSSLSFSLKNVKPFFNMAKSNTSPVESIKTQSTARKLSFDDNMDFEKSTDVSEDFQLDCDFIIRSKKDSHAKSAPLSCFKKLCFDSSEDNNDLCLPGLQNKTSSIFSFEAEACEKEIFSQSSGDSTMEEEVSNSQEITIDIFLKGNQYQLENRRRCDSFQTDSEERQESLDACNDIISQGMASQAPCLQISANLRDPDLWTISSQTLVNLINEGKKRYLIIDCRYDYEYKGGHIQDAINIDSRECLERLFFNNRLKLNQDKHLEQVKDDLQEFFRGSYLIGPSEDEESSEPPILIFHCEFSQKRGPRAMRALRSLDRQLNVHRWPELYYPQTYLLEEGYQSFQGLFPEYCNPQNSYVKMLDKNFKQEYSSARENEKKSWKKTISFKHMSETSRFSQRSKTISY